MKLKNVARFHDPLFDPEVSEAHDFVAGTLGLDVVGPKKVAVIPFGRKLAVGKEVGGTLSDGQHDMDSRNILVVAEEDYTDESLVTRIVHELTHDGTLQTRRARNSHEFVREALAGMAEGEFLDELARQGRRIVPESRIALGSLPFYLPGRYSRLEMNGDIAISQAAMAASAMSLVSQLSGISEKDILSAASGRGSQHIDLVGQSLEVLGPYTVGDLNRYPKGTSGVMMAAADIEAKAVRYGALMESHEAFSSLFPPEPTTFRGGGLIS